MSMSSGSDLKNAVQNGVSSAAWPAVLAAARSADGLKAAKELLARLPAGDPHSAILDLYLPICSATGEHPITIGHLGQSLDGFIATHAGESRFVTGQENIVHLHRLRALCDAVVVGSRTVTADDPQLTTRLVEGPNPLRVIIDPARRLAATHKVFTDQEAETLYVCARSLVKTGEQRLGCATIVGIDDHPDGPGSVNVAALVQMLRARGCSRIFVEGGGVTVSMFLEANMLDRLHMTVAPLIIGDGRPAIRLAARALLGDCRRPSYRVFRMGGDVLFDCDLRSRGDDTAISDAVTRII
jgi:diaminohydroxyphosphoribosylaminopyrimidine deaminase/5-amino-6-(5-phosphoribosylamino)uracil reductase